MAQQLFGVDCSTSLTFKMAQGLKDEGVSHVGRYLGDPDSWKTIDPNEANAISAAGLQIFSIYETSPTYRGYFTEAKGRLDAAGAVKWARSIKQPNGTPVYFGVDYPEGNDDLDVIEQYFKAIRQSLTGYAVGCYGSYYVVKHLLNKGLIDFVWQTYAWSDGKVADGIHLYQHKNGQTLAGVLVDYDKVFKHPGSWSLSGMDLYTIEEGDTFWELENSWGLHHGTLEKLNPDVNPQALQIGEKIHVPADVRPDTKNGHSESHSHHKKASVPYPGHLFEVTNPYMHGEDVKRIQRALNNAVGYQLVKVDGYYGPKTAAAVRDYQDRHNLDDVDGIVGPETWKEMF